MKNKTLRLLLIGMFFFSVILGGIITYTHSAAACTPDREDDNDWGRYSAKMLAIQDSDPSNFVGGGIQSTHQADETFPIYVFITNAGRWCQPQTLDYNVTGIVSVTNGRQEIDYPVTIQAGKTYGTVNVTCSDSGWYGVQATENRSNDDFHGNGNGNGNGNAYAYGHGRSYLFSRWYSFYILGNSTTLSIQPSKVTLSPGGTQQLQAMITVAGRSYTVTASYNNSWSSSDSGVASVENNDYRWWDSNTPGLVTAGSKTGTATITSTYEIGWWNWLWWWWQTRQDLTGTYTAVATVNVDTPVLKVSPDSPQVPIGVPIQLTAQLVYPNNSTPDDVTNTAQWVSSDPGVASVQNASDGTAGFMTGNKSGTAVITATVNGVSGTTTITVMTPTMQVFSEPSPLVLKNGETSQLTAKLVYPDGSKPIDVTGLATWTSNSNAVTVGNTTGLVTAKNQGTATVTASLYGVSGSVTVTVVQPTFMVDPNPLTINVGDTFELKAYYAPGGGTPQDFSAQTSWKSNNLSVATVSPTGKVQGIAAGSATVTAIYQGLTVTIPVTVISPTLVLSPSSVTLFPNMTSSLKATYTDANNPNGLDVTSSASWSSSSNSIASVDNTGKVTGVASGSATITANYKQTRAQVQVSVNGKPTGLIVTPASAAANPGWTVQLRAYAQTQNGNIDVTDLATWSSSDPSIASVDNEQTKGLVTASQVSVKPVNITASFSGIKPPENPTASSTFAVTTPGFVWEQEPDPTKP